MLKHTAILCLIALCVGCTSSKEPLTPEETTDDIAILEPLDESDDIWELEASPGISATIALPKQATLEKIERFQAAPVFIRIPDSSPEKYSVQWGFTPDTIGQQLEVPVSRLAIVQSAIHGQLYKIDLLSEIQQAHYVPPGTQELFYSVRAVTNESDSRPTPIGRIPVALAR